MLAMGTVAATNLAGCGGREPEGPTPIPQNGTEEPVDVDENTVVSRVPWNWPVGDTQFNNFASASNTPSAQNTVFFDNLVTYHETAEEFVYELADGAPTMEGCELHVELKEDYYWWDGTPVTAWDRVIPHNIIVYFCCGGPDSVPWNAQFVEEYEFMENKIGQFNQAFASINMLRNLWAKGEFWRDDYERLQDATTDDEVQSIVQDIRDVDLTIDDVIEEGYGYGLWKPTDYTANTLTLEKHDQHPQADETDIERWVWRMIPNDQSFIQAFKQDQFDYGNSEYRENVENPPDNIEEIVNYSGRTGRKLGMNWRNKHLARRPVRRAINYFLDLEDLATISGDVTAVSQQTAGMPDSLVEAWLDEDFLDQLIDYGPEAKPDEAERVMQEAGYERQNGVWTDEDGDRMEGLRFISSSLTNEALLGDTISSQLSDFGIETDFSSLESATFQNVMGRSEGNSDFDLAIHMAGPLAPHPSRIWGYTHHGVVDWFSGSADVQPAEECGVEAPQVDWTAEQTPIFQIPVDPAPTHPETVGQRELDGDGQAFDPIETSALMRLDVGQDRIDELSRRWAWWVNFNAFHVYLHSQNRRMWLDTESFQVDDDPVVTGINYGQGPLCNGSVSLR
jgi:ABC-type transport system substrate-binding protein